MPEPFDSNITFIKGYRIMQLYVKTMLGKMIPLDISDAEFQNERLILIMKQQIFEKTGCPIENQRLIMAGKALKNAWSRDDVTRETGQFQHGTTMHLVFSLARTEEFFTPEEAAQMNWATVHEYLSADCRASLSEETRPLRKPHGMNSVDIEHYWESLSVQKRKELLTSAAIAPYFAGVTQEQKRDLFASTLATDVRTEQRLALLNDYLLTPGVYEKIRDNPIYQTYLETYRETVLRDYPDTVDFTEIAPQYHYRVAVQQTLERLLTAYPDFDFLTPSTMPASQKVPVRPHISVPTAPPATASAAPEAGLSKDKDRLPHQQGFFGSRKTFSLRDAEQCKTNADTLLRQFFDKIEAIQDNGSNNNKKAISKAYELYGSWETKIDSAFKKGEISSAADLLNTASKIRTEMQASIPYLQKNLGWGAYISNLGTALLNILISAANMILVMSIRPRELIASDVTQATYVCASGIVNQIEALAFEPAEKISAFAYHQKQKHVSYGFPEEPQEPTDRKYSY